MKETTTDLMQTTVDVVLVKSSLIINRLAILVHPIMRIDNSREPQ